MPDHRASRGGRGRCCRAAESSSCTTRFRFPLPPPVLNGHVSSLSAYGVRPALHPSSGLCPSTALQWALCRMSVQPLERAAGSHTASLSQFFLQPAAASAAWRSLIAAIAPGTVFPTPEKAPGARTGVGTQVTFSVRAGIMRDS
jgi:hypothetical protein